MIGLFLVLLSILNGNNEAKDLQRVHSHLKRQGADEISGLIGRRGNQQQSRRPNNGAHCGDRRRLKLRTSRQAKKQNRGPRPDNVYAHGVVEKRIASDPTKACNVGEKPLYEKKRCCNSAKRQASFGPRRIGYFALRCCCRLQRYTRVTGFSLEPRKDKHHGEQCNDPHLGKHPLRNDRFRRLADKTEVVDARNKKPRGDNPRNEPCCVIPGIRKKPVRQKAQRSSLEKRRYHSEGEILGLTEESCYKNNKELHG